MAGEGGLDCEVRTRTRARDVENGVKPFYTTSMLRIHGLHALGAQNSACMTTLPHCSATSCDFRLAHPSALCKHAPRFSRSLQLDGAAPRHAAAGMEWKSERSISGAR